MRKLSRSGSRGKVYKDIFILLSRFFSAHQLLVSPEIFLPRESGDPEVSERALLLLGPRFRGGKKDLM
jgi:hypothetical protein